MKRKLLLFFVMLFVSIGTWATITTGSTTWCQYNSYAEQEKLYNDLLKQFKMIKRMGSLSKIMGFLPGMGKMKAAMNNVDDKAFDKIEYASLIFTSVSCFL